MRDESIPEVPFSIRDGWPEPLANAGVTAREAGIQLGSLFLTDADWSALQASVVFALRIDEHPPMTGYTTRSPDGTETRTDFVIPTRPVVAPAAALTGGNAFSDWVWETLGADGLLLVWDQSREWWLVHDPDLEVQIVCAPPSTFEPDPHPGAPFAWLPGLTTVGRGRVAMLTARYGLTTKID
jgi:hypothetical protein